MVLRASEVQLEKMEDRFVDVYTLFIILYLRLYRVPRVLKEERERRVVQDHRYAVLGYMQCYKLSHFSIRVFLAEQASQDLLVILDQRYE